MAWQLYDACGWMVSGTIMSLGLALAAPWVRGQSPVSGLESSAFDRDVRAQDDLYQAVNGTWLRETEIPSDKSNYGSFTILDDLSQERIRAIVEETARSSQAAGSDAEKLGNLYRSFMDEDRVREVGITPLKPYFEAIEALDSHATLFQFFGQCQVLRVQTPLALFVDQDDRNSSQHLTAIIQSGITLPDRDYYLEDDDKYVAARDALRKYIGRLWSLRGIPSASVAEDLLALETRLAKVQWERTELRDAEKRYNKFAVSELASKFPGVNWQSFLEAADVGSITELNVTTPSYFEALANIYAETPLATWKQYLEFKVLDAFAPYLPPDFEMAHFELHQQALAGVPEQQPRWKRAIELISGADAGDFGALGDVAGKLYVDRHFPPASKARMDQLVANLLEAYKQSIAELSWMTPETKQRAQDKLAKITTKIGYPTKWRDYQALVIDPQDLLGNVIRSRQVEHQRMIKKLGQPVDREEWGMTPQTVNAYYNPSKNEIVFPAAILQPPFFHPQADDAVNYGGIGAVIGHEISHAFDDQGSKYDGDGNLNNWWTARDQHAFKELTKRLVVQFNQYEPLPGKHVNGELTLGENIADLSGLSIAHKAYHIALDGKTPPEVDGWSGDQRFFLGWSQAWRRKYRDAEMMQRLLVDPHAPSWYRANGPVVNIDAFYDAFHVQPTDKLYRPPSERIRIW